ncbi:hypothetical protein C8A05DRAFT_38399, partial [Staphylotrichum tortipilum]
MEAIGGGASVLAFITVAIQSAKTISDLLSGIKDAPDNVRRTAETVSMLQSALEQLAKWQQESGAALPQVLEGQVKACSNNLEAYAFTLGKLQALDTDGRGRRAWKRARAVLDEKQLDKMIVTMAAHSSALGLSLQPTQIAALRGGKEQISQLFQNISARLQDISHRWDVVQVGMSTIHTSLAEADARREEQWSNIRTTLDQTTAACDATRTSSDEQLRCLQALAARLIRVETKVDQQDTQNQFSQIWDTLQLLSGSIQSQPDNELKTKALKDAKLRGCINRLLNQADQDNRTVSADDVDSIFDDLKYVLAAVNDERDDLVNVKNLERARGVLSAAEILSINGTEDLEDIESADAHAENSDADVSDADVSDADVADADGSDADGSDADVSDTTESSDDDEREWSRLQALFESVSKRSLDKISKENFAACFPTAAAKAPGTLEFVQRQMVERLGGLWK